MPKYITQHRRNTTEGWQKSGDSIKPLAGEIVIEICNDNKHRLKIGDGYHTYNELAYMSVDDFILSQSTSRVVTILLPLDAWEPVEGKDATWSQVVNVGDVTASSKIDLQPTSEQLTELTWEEVTLVASNDNGIVTVYAINAKPTKGYSMQATISTVERAHNYKEEVTEPTCVDYGYTTHTCLDCGDRYTSNFVDPLGHDTVVYEGKAPTCTESGWDAYETCTRCDYTTYKEQPALGHDLVHYDAKEPTCTEIGWNAYDVCSRCDYTTYEEIPATGHAYKLVVDGASTEYEPGDSFDKTNLAVTLRCTNCDFSEEVTEYTVSKEENLQPEDGKVIISYEKDGATYSVPVLIYVAHEHITGDLVPAKEATCTEDGNIDYYACTVCGHYFADKEATQPIDAIIPATGHTTVIIPAVAPTCTETGLTEGQKCAVCGEIIVAQEEVPALGHTEVIDEAVAATCTEAGKTEGKHCAVCGEVFVRQEDVPPIGHVFGEWYVNIEPTEYREGEKRRKCVNCNVYEASVIAQLSHDHNKYDSAIIAAVEPTCLVPGLTEGIKCSHCGEVLVSQKSIPALGHDFTSENTDEQYLKKPATCMSKALYFYSCIRCGIKDTETFEAGELGAHTLDKEKVTLEPTCTVSGSKVKVCTVCGFETETEEMPALGHDLIHHGAQDPTCTENGWDEYESCDRCDYTTCVEIPALGHDLVHHEAQAPTCTENGWDEYDTCSRCNYTTYDKIPALGHDLVHHDAKAPNCTEIGWEEYDTCSRCDYTTYVEMSALGHDYVDGVCSRCGEEYYTKGLLYRLNNHTDDIEDNEYYTVAGMGGISDTEMWIPSKFDGVDVTSIEKNAFYGNSKLTSIGIRAGIGTIEAEAFRGCSNLTTVEALGSITKIAASTFRDCSNLENINIPDSVTSIEEYAFADCTKLTNVTIPSQVETIKWYVFSGCTNLESVFIPCSVTFISDHVFNGCSKLTHIRFNGSMSEWKTINKSEKWDDGTEEYQVLCNDGIIYKDGTTADEDVIYVLSDDNQSYIISRVRASATNVIIPSTHEGLPITQIGESAFSSCSNLMSVDIPDSITSIGDSAFYNCRSLTSIVIPDSVTSIGGLTFYSCGLRSVKIGDNVTSIGGRAFESCRSLKNVVIPDSVTTIGKWAFKYCDNLTSVVIGDGVTSIGDEVFYDCGKLESVTISDSVKSIGTNAFWRCSSLTSVYITDIAAWCNISFSGPGSNPLDYAHNLYLNNELIAELIIPDSVTEIKDYAFYNCTNLTSIIIPDSVISIGIEAFCYCDGLTSAAIGDGVTSIGANAFRGCSSLTNTVFGDNIQLTNIDSGAFYDCRKLTSIIIPEDVMSIEADTFDYCVALTEITIPNSVGSIDNSAFTYCSNLAKIRYTGDKMDWYKLNFKPPLNDQVGQYMVICNDGYITFDGLETDMEV